MLVFFINLIKFKIINSFSLKKRVTYAERVSQESGEGGIQRGLLFPR
jgi:hypothetical protein